MHTYFQFIDTDRLNAKLKSGEFPFRQNLFWDTPLSNIDLQKNKRYIIERVLTRGFLEDFYVLLKLYKEEDIKDALRKSKELDPKTVNFCSIYFNISKQEMHASSFYD